MISRELAQELKNAGLKWKPQKDDCFTFAPQTVPQGPGKARMITITSGTHCLTNVCKVGRYTRFNPPNSIWLPNLAQLQAEISTRGGQITLQPVDRKAPETDQYQCILQFENQEDDPFRGIFKGTGPEEAAGRALLWLIRQTEQ